MLYDQYAPLLTVLVRRDSHFVIGVFFDFLCQCFTSNHSAPRYSFLHRARTSVLHFLTCNNFSHPFLDVFAVFALFSLPHADAHKFTLVLSFVHAFTCSYTLIVVPRLLLRCNFVLTHGFFRQMNPLTATVDPLHETSDNDSDTDENNPLQWPLPVSFGDPSENDCQTPPPFIQPTAPVQSLYLSSFIPDLPAMHCTATIASPALNSAALNCCVLPPLPPLSPQLHTGEHTQPSLSLPPCATISLLPTLPSESQLFASHGSLAQQPVHATAFRSLAAQPADVCCAETHSPTSLHPHPLPSDTQRDSATPCAEPAIADTAPPNRATTPCEQNDDRLPTPFRDRTTTPSPALPPSLEMDLSTPVSSEPFHANAHALAAFDFEPVATQPLTYTPSPPLHFLQTTNGLTSTAQSPSTSHTTSALTTIVARSSDAAPMPLAAPAAPSAQPTTVVGDALPSLLVSRHLALPGPAPATETHDTPSHALAQQIEHLIRKVYARAGVRDPAALCEQCTLCLLCFAMSLSIFSCSLTFCCHLHYRYHFGFRRLWPLHWYHSVRLSSSYFCPSALAVGRSTSTTRFSRNTATQAPPPDTGSGDRTAAASCTTHSPPTCRSVAS